MVNHQKAVTTVATEKLFPLSSHDFSPISITQQNKPQLVAKINKNLLNNILLPVLFTVSITGLPNSWSTISFYIYATINNRAIYTRENRLRIT